MAGIRLLQKTPFDSQSDGTSERVTVSNFKMSGRLKLEPCKD